MHVSETHFAPFALPALLRAESLVVGPSDARNAVYCGGVHLQEMQQSTVDYTEKCRCSRVGGHNGDVEDGGCQTSKINQVATAAGAKPAAGKGQGACATITSTGRILADVRGVWRA